MLRKLLLLLCFTALYVPSLFAQTGTIKGTITDAKTGETLPGANVVLLQIHRGASSDANGNYTLSNIPTGTYKLHVSFIGYQTYTQQVKVTNRVKTINIDLKPGAKGLKQLVVTGTGLQTEKSLTTSIAHVNSQDFEKVPLENTAAILQGRAAGVQVTQTSGNPGTGLSVRVRGQGSINGSGRPLYIVDGVQISFSGRSGLVDESPLNGISPDDIESISVLKDASATAIYGAQGANGVVLVTTKRGQNGPTQVSATVERGVRQNIKSVDYFNRDQFIKYFTRAGDNTYGAGFGDAYIRDVVLPAYGLANAKHASPFYRNPHATYTGDYSKLPNTNWTDFVNQTGITQNYKMSISGGTDQSRYRISGGYVNQEGHIKNYDFQNYHIRGNFDQQITDRFSTKLNLALSNQKTTGTCQDGFFINCPVSQAGFIGPFAVPYNKDGSYSQDFRIIPPSTNPAITFNETSRNVSTVHIIGDISGTYDLAQWVSLHTLFGMDWKQVHDKRYDTKISAPSTNGSISESFRTVPNFNTKTTLNFNHSFGEMNNFSALLGFEYRRDYYRFLTTRGTQLANTIGVLNGAANPLATGGRNLEYRKAGYFANVKYNYDQRYFINLTGRYDGSSRFGANNRFGFFPAVSAAWDISSEDFFNTGWVEDLKLRASYGSSGNSLIGRFPALGLYGVRGNYGGTAGFRPTQLANPDLTWEKATTLDVGVDWSLFSGRFTGTIDAYRKQNSNLLLNTPLPIDSGFGSITRNVGKTQNEGLEFSFNSVNVRAGDFQWSSNFNFTVQKNTVKDLNGDVHALNPGSTTPVAIGHSINALKVWKWAGADPADGRPTWYDKNGNLTHNPSDSDRQFIDGGEQDVIGGFGNTFQYKGFSLNFLFQYSFGQTAAPVQVWAFGLAQVGSTQSNGVVTLLDHSWDHPGDLAEFPYPKFGPTNYPGTQFYSSGANGAQFYDASYIRLKNVSFSYSLPVKVTNALHLRNLQLYVSALNLLTFTNYPGFDPEIAGSVNGFNNTTNQRASYPAARVINGGITIKF